MNVRNWKLAAASAAVVAGLGFATPAAAHPHPKTERVIIFTDSHDGPAAKGPHRMRRFHIEGPRGLIECDGERTEVSEGGEDDGEKTRIVLCSKSGDSAAHRERLERALSRIQSNEHLSAEHRERITARLREALERIGTESR